jgi:hypothetical protein
MPNFRLAETPHEYWPEAKLIVEGKEPESAHLAILVQLEGGKHNTWIKRDESISNLLRLWRLSTLIQLPLKFLFFASPIRNQLKAS